MIYHLLFKRNRQSSIVNRQSHSGFTLIELLIVIAIIGILSAILMANLVGVRQRARDAQRKSDLRQIQSALELYRSDSITGYPASPLPSCGSSLTSGTTTYMQKIPCDPQGTTYWNAGNYYYVSSGGITYTLGACVENSNDTDTNIQSTNPIPGYTGTTCASGKYYVLTQP